MPRDGSGNFVLVSGNPVVPNTVVSSSGWANPTLNDLAAGLTQSLSRDGQTTPTANLSMGNFRLTSLASAIARTDAANAGQVQDGTLVLLVSVTGTDTITASTSPAITAYAAGQVFRFATAGANLSANVTLNINGLGAKAVKKAVAQYLSPGDLPASAMVEVIYDGTQFQLIGGAYRSGSLPPRFRDLTRGETSASTTSATVNAGAWRSFGDGADLILNSAISKTLQATGSWTAGSGNNGLFSGSRANSTMYHFFVIQKDSDGTLDAGFDTSITAANRPTGYTEYRRVASIWFATGAFAPYNQAGDEFFYAPQLNIFSNSGATSGSNPLTNLLCPNGFKSVAYMRLALIGNSGAAAGLVDVGASSPAAGGFDVNGDTVTGTPVASAIISRLTNSSGLLTLWASQAISSGLYMFAVGRRDFLED